MINSDRVSPIMLRMAEEGDVQKQFEVANLYLSDLFGKPTSAEVQQGLYWLSSAAKQGHVRAMEYLGKIYTTGKWGLPEFKLCGFTKDIDTGLKLYFIAISQGSPNAEREAHTVIREEIMMEILGSGESSVLSELRKVAEQGNPLAQSCLGECYCSYYAALENIPEARKWLTKAAAQGIKTAAYHLKRLC